MVSERIRDLDHGKLVELNEKVHEVLRGETAVPSAMLLNSVRNPPSSSCALNTRTRPAVTWRVPDSRSAPRLSRAIAPATLPRAAGGADGQLGEAVPQRSRRFRRCLPRVVQHFMGMERHAVE
jgi:hypothetical protein